MWSTIQADQPMKLLDVLNECTVRLIYLGTLHFGVLTWKPRLPKKVAMKSPSFNIVEEYTLDEEDTVQTLTGKSAPVHVETSSSSMQQISADITPTRLTSNVKQCKVEQCTVTISTADQGGDPSTSASLAPDPPSCALSVAASSLANDGSLHVGTEDKNAMEAYKFVPGPTTHPADAIVLSKYPWRKEPWVKLTLLPEVDIDIWCGRVGKYYQYSPTLQIKIVSVKGARKQSIKMELDETEPPQEDETHNLIDHAQSLLEQAKVFVTKPVKEKHRDKPRVIANPVKHGKRATDDAIASLHDKTVGNLAPLHVGTDGSSNVDRETTLKKRKVQCKMCPNSFSSVRELNVHHREDHGIVKCPDCEKVFNNQSSLDKHSYVHKELKYNCEQCGKRFPFESRLEQHQMTHINVRLSCPKKSCTRTFKSVGDVNHHVKSHTKGGWHKCAHCDYKNKDKRNTESYMRTHTKKEDRKYVCDKCGKHMRYSTQFIRHKQQGCDV